MTDTRSLRIAIGPFDPDDDGTTWPIVGAHELLPEFEVLPFSRGEVPAPGSEAIVVWSPEYLPHDGEAYFENREDVLSVACVGDWHVRDPDVSRYDLVCSDQRYVRTHPGQTSAWFRMFSFDPRLHFPPDAGAARDIDVAFCGRQAPGRMALIGRVSEWCERTGRRGSFLLDPYKRGEEADVYRRAKIVLGHSQRGELQMRAYEAMACGAMYLVQHDCEEVFCAHAPIPTYEPSSVTDTLEAWLTDDAARERQVALQRAWVATERPVDHLRWLCRLIAAHIPF